ncbi:hypothetical protein [Helicobacter sp. T3_23-1059]
MFSTLFTTLTKMVEPLFMALSAFWPIFAILLAIIVVYKTFKG